jgi:succinate-acetate transporter protein
VEVVDHAHQGIIATDTDGGLSQSDPRGPARAELADRIEHVVRIELRPIANPLPLGFIALAGGTVTLAALNLGWVEQAESPNIALVLIAFVFPLQLLASIFGALARDSVAATGMGILAATWLTLGLVMRSNPPGSTSDAVGVLLLVVAIAMLIPAAAASVSKLVPAAVLGGAALRFASSAAYQLGGGAGWETLTGWLGMALAVLALYAALAMLLEGTAKRSILPLGRRDRGRQAVEGGFTEQVVDLAHEPGVRAQL